MAGNAKKQTVTLTKQSATPASYSLARASPYSNAHETIKENKQRGANEGLTCGGVEVCFLVVVSLGAEEERVCLKQKQRRR